VILAYVVIFLAGLALLLRRDLSAIGKIPYRGGWKLITIVVALFAIQATLIVYAPGQATLQMVMLILTQLALLLLFLINRHVSGAKLFALGTTLNLVVMVANGGWMPVTPENYQYIHPERTLELETRPPSSKNILLPRSETNLWFLSDIIRVRLWRRWALSIGDVLLMVGAAQLIFQATPTKKRQRPGWSDAGQ